MFTYRQPSINTHQENFQNLWISKHTSTSRNLEEYHRIWISDFLSQLGYGSRPCGIYFGYLPDDVPPHDPSNGSVYGVYSVACTLIIEVLAHMKLNLQKSSAKVRNFTPVKIVSNVSVILWTCRDLSSVYSKICLPILRTQFISSGGYLYSRGRVSGGQRLI